LRIAIDRWKRAFVEFHTRTSTPEVDAVVMCGVEIFKCVSQTMIMVFVGGTVSLRKLHSGICEIRVSSGHSPYQFTDTTSVRKFHGRGKVFLNVDVRVPNGGIKFLGPIRVRREWCRAVRHSQEGAHPGRKIFLGDLLNERHRQNFNVVTSLEDIYAIIHVKVSLTLHWNREFVVDEIQEDVGSQFVGSGDGKVVNLAFQEDLFTVDHAGVEAWFVDRRGQPNIA
jgi:hypothetical protein